MSETIIVAVLSLAGTLCGAYFANRRSSALIAYRLEQLEKKAAALGSLVERTYRLEERAELHEEKLKAANRRLGALEQARS